MKIQNVLYLTYDGNNIPSVRDTVDENTLGTLLSGNLFNPLCQELYNAIYLSGVDPEPDNTRLYEVLLRHKKTIDNNNAQTQGYDKELSLKGNEVLSNLQTSIAQRVRNNRLIWNSNIQGMQNSLNHRLDRINAVITEFSTALTGGIFPSATDTPQCLHCNGANFSQTKYWQLYYVLRNQAVPNLGGYYLRGASAGGSPYKVMTALPDSVYFGVAVNQSMGSFVNHHDTSYYVESGSNDWSKATGCFQEHITSGWRWVYDNGGKGSHDADKREIQTIGLNLGLINTFKHSIETRPKTITFNWVMYGGLPNSNTWLPKQPNPYAGGLAYNLVPLVVTSSGGTNTGTTVNPHGNQADLTMAYSQTSYPMSVHLPVFNYWSDTRYTTINVPAPTVTDAAGNVIDPNVQVVNGMTTSNLRFSIDTVPTFNGTPIQYYQNLFNEYYGTDAPDDVADAPSDPLENALNPYTGAINATSDQLFQFLSNTGLLGLTGNIGISVQCNSATGKGMGKTDITFQLGNYPGAPVIT